MADKSSACVITLDAINGRSHDKNSAEICEVSITPGGKFGKESVSNPDRIVGGFVKLSFKLCELTLRRTGHNCAGVGVI